MKTLVFISVATVLVFLALRRNMSGTSGKDPEAARGTIPLQPPRGDDEHIRILAFNPKEEKDAQAFGCTIEESLDGVLSGYLCSGCSCRVEFVTVGLCLVAVVRIRTAPDGVRKKGTGKIWKNRQ